MHLPSTSNRFILDAFNHRELAGLGDCGCMKFKGIGDGPRRGVGDATSALIGGGISAGVGLATSAASLWLSSIQLSHQADTATTQIVNGLEPLLRQNVNAYLAGPGTCADQSAAMDAYLTAATWLISARGCGNGAYGSAGNRCISDRFGPGGPTDTTGARWPWAAYYYWPIANDPRAAACAASAAAANPDAAEQSAITNLINSTVGGGNAVQTNALDFASTQTGASNAVTGSSAASSVTNAFGNLLSPTSTVSIAGVAVPEVALVGLVAVMVALFVMEGR